MAVALILALLLSACAASAPQPNRSTDQPTDQAIDGLPIQPVLRHSLFDVSNLQEAATWYNQYHTFAPDDLLGLKRLTEVCTALEEGRVDDESCRKAALRVSGSTFYAVGNSETLDLKLETSPAGVLQEALKARTDDRRIVAELLGVRVEAVDLGPNLVENGGFEDWTDGQPLYWTWSAMFNREPFDQAIFTGGREELDVCNGMFAARIDGLWVRQAEGRSNARAGFWWEGDEPWLASKIPVDPGVLYLLSVRYRTVDLESAQASAWISRDQAMCPDDHLLRSTYDSWQRFILVGVNSMEIQAALQPLVRSWGTGPVWFDDVSVRRIELLPGVAHGLTGTQCVCLKDQE